MPESQHKQIIELIKRSEKILVLPSSPPDGDSLGSAVALYMVLRKLDKQVTVVCSEPIPDVLQFLPNIKVIGDRLVNSSDFIITIDLKNAKIDHIKSSIEDNKVNIILSPREGKFHEEDVSFNKGKARYDLIITVDTAELSQLRSFYDNNLELFQEVPIINIDHHVSNTSFGKVNFVDVMASSTTEILVPLIEKLAEESGKELFDDDVATLLLTGIVTDTGSFQNANTTPKSFDVAANLVGYGARQQEIIRHIYKTKQLSQLKLWGRVLSKIQTDEDHKIVWSTVSQQDFKDTGSNSDQTGDIIDELMSNAPGAQVILLIKEKDDGSISGSLRTTTPAVDASKIAQKFNGGGHVQAAGFRINNISLREAEHQIIEEIKAFQSNMHNIGGEKKELPEIEVTSEKKTKEEKPKSSLNLKSPLNGTTELQPGTTYKFED